MGGAERPSPRPWLEVGGGLTSSEEQTFTVASYLASRLGSLDWLPPPPLEDPPHCPGFDDGLAEPDVVCSLGSCIRRERDGVATAVRAALGAARADSALAGRLHAPLPLGRRPTILLDLAVNIVTAVERSSAGIGVPAAAPLNPAVLNHAVDALGMADAYAEASAVRQHRRRWLAAGLLVAAAAAGEADARWLELGFLAEAAPRLAPCARAWQVARMPSRSDALIDLILAMPGRLDRLAAEAPSREPARALAEEAKRVMWVSLGGDGEIRRRLVDLAASTSPDRRARLLACSESSEGQVPGQ